MAMLDSPGLFYLTPDGKLMRGDKGVKDLPREELLKVIDELVDLFRKTVTTSQ